MIYFSANTQYEVCFTPAQDCTQELVQRINQAKQSIFVQSYSFTSGKIARALYQAFKRGVNVKIIFDKSAFNCRQFSYSSFFIRKHMAIWADRSLRIAHNKVMVFDGRIVETGSFNFTSAAQYKNAENMLFINSRALAHDYLANWQRRQEASRPVKKDFCHRRYY